MSMDVFRQKHLKREQVEALYREFLGRLEEQLLRLHCTRVTATDPGDKTRLDADVKRVRRELAALEDDFRLWQEGNPAEGEAS